MDYLQICQWFEEHEVDEVIITIHSPHSYRGYYDQIAYEYICNSSSNVSSFLQDIKDGLDDFYEGYKGGSFFMDDETDIHLAFYGNTGVPVTEELLQYISDPKNDFRNFLQE